MKEATSIGMTGRIEWLDYLKGIMIIFVVIQHADIYRYSRGWDIYITSFHMPLFFFVSGMLLKEKYVSVSAFQWTWKKVLTRLLPYFSFVLIVWLLHSLIDFGLHVREYNFGRLAASIKANTGMGRFDHLWFLPNLFVAEVLFFLVIFKINNRWFQLILLLVSSIIGYIIVQNINYRFPFSVDIALTSIVFYGIGYFSSKALLNTKPEKTAYFYPVLILLGIYFAMANGRVGLFRRDLGNYFLFYAASVTSIFSWALICSRLPIKLHLLSYIGKSTLYIFAFHRVVIHLMDWLNLKQYIPVRITASNRPFIYTIVAVSSLTLLSIYIEKIMKYFKITNLYKSKVRNSAAPQSVGEI